MKKLMVVIAAVAMGFAANAATVTWQAFNDFTALDGDGTIPLDNGHAYFFDALKVTQADVIKALGTDGDLTVLGSALGDVATGEWGDFSMLKGGLSYNDSDKAYGYILLLDDAVAAKAENFWLSDVKDVPITGTIKEGDDAVFTFGEMYATSGWQEVASVPEPTSGLLLLLGVAGLALRRRRA